RDQPLLHPRRVGDLVGEPRLAHPGLADDGDQLAATHLRLAEDPTQVLDLGGAPDEPREAPEGRHLQPGARGPDSRQLEDLDGIREALDWDRPERPNVDVALRPPHALTGQPHRPGW